MSWGPSSKTIYNGLLPPWLLAFLIYDVRELDYMTQHAFLALSSLNFIIYIKNIFLTSAICHSNLYHK